jgi:hypothetical protein
MCTVSGEEQMCEALRILEKRGRSSTFKVNER